MKKFHEFSLACGLRSQLTNVRFAALCEFRFTTGNVLALTMAAVTQRHCTKRIDLHPNHGDTLPPREN